jgi:hypothetical protein
VAIAAEALANGNTDRPKAAQVKASNEEKRERTVTSEVRSLDEAQQGFALMATTQR